MIRLFGLLEYTQKGLVCSNLIPTATLGCGLPGYGIASFCGRLWTIGGSNPLAAMHPGPPLPTPGQEVPQPATHLPANQGRIHHPPQRRPENPCYSRAPSGGQGVWRVVWRGRGVSSRMAVTWQGTEGEVQTQSEKSRHQGVTLPHRRFGHHCPKHRCLDAIHRRGCFTRKVLF